MGWILTPVQTHGPVLVQQGLPGLERITETGPRSKCELYPHGRLPPIIEF